jgi:ferredoxin-thioredoxin reductase catalytic subunit
MEKLIKDGKVAVVYSPGFGAGWSTWADDEAQERLCLDKELAQAVLDGDPKRAEEIGESICPGMYTGGVRDLTIEWLDPGTRFEINEYDGSESVRYINDDWFVA